MKSFVTGGERLWRPDAIDPVQIAPIHRRRLNSPQLTLAISQMTYENRPLGRTGLYVSELCLSTMTFGGQGARWKVVDESTKARQYPGRTCARRRCQFYRQRRCLFGRPLRTVRLSQPAICSGDHCCRSLIDTVRLRTGRQAWVTGAIIDQETALPCLAAAIRPRYAPGRRRATVARFRYIH